MVVERLLILKSDFMSKEENVINYYVMCNKLKNIIRTGWLDWKVSKERVESVAEHIYGTQMLALAMKSEYNYDIDIMKVLYMLAIHELGETIIGDLTQFQISKEEKIKIEHEAVCNVLKDLVDGDIINNLYLEFDERITKEAQFAHFCDKLECDLQAKLYDEEGYVDINNQNGNKTYNHPDVQKLINKGYSFSEMWLTFGQEKYNYDDNFMSVSNYAKTHKISKYRDM